MKVQSIVLGCEVESRALGETYTCMRRTCKISTEGSQLGLEVGPSGCEARAQATTPLYSPICTFIATFLSITYHLSGQFCFSAGEISQRKMKCARATFSHHYRVPLQCFFVLFFACRPFLHDFCHQGPQSQVIL